MSEPIVFLRLLGGPDRNATLIHALASLRDGQDDDAVYEAAPASFQQVPGSPFGYWMTNHVRRIYAVSPTVKSLGWSVQHGASTKEDFRFLRLWIEMSPTRTLNGLGGPPSSDASFASWCRTQTFDRQPWVPFVKGGGHEAFYADVPLAIFWSRDGGALEERLLEKYPYLGDDANWVLHRECSYFLPGVSWPRCPWQRGHFAHIGAGCLFADKGPMFFVPKAEHWNMLALVNSDAFTGLLHTLLGRGGHDTDQTLIYDIGRVGIVPVARPGPADVMSLGDLAKRGYFLTRDIDRPNELAHVFDRPSLLRAGGTTVNDRAEAWEAVLSVARVELAQIKAEIDEIAFRLYDIQGEDRAALVASLQPTPPADAGDADPEMVEGMDGDAEALDEEPEPEEGAASPTAPPDRRSLVFDLISYALGCAFGRWDARIGRDPTLAPAIADPFAPLPVCSPAMLVGADGLPAPRHGIVSVEWLRARPDVVSLPTEGAVE
jgi:hypothetical protein